VKDGATVLGEHRQARLLGRLATPLPTAGADPRSCCASPIPRDTSVTRDSRFRDLPGGSRDLANDGRRRWALDEKPPPPCRDENPVSWT
jgi:hypothetical protein